MCWTVRYWHPNEGPIPDVITSGTFIFWRRNRVRIARKGLIATSDPTSSATASCRVTKKSFSPRVRRLCGIYYLKDLVVNFRP
jgi:hypothetical protein